MLWVLRLGRKQLAHMGQSQLEARLRQSVRGAPVRGAYRAHPVERRPAVADDAGFGLLFVLLVVGVMALIGASFALAVRAHVREAASAAETARAEALADAGVNLAILELVSLRVDRTARRRIAMDGTGFACRIGESGPLLIEVEDEGGKVDLNAAEPGLLRALLIGVGVAEPEASVLAERIADFRNGDRDQRAGGAEAPRYAAAGLAHGPKDAPFDATEELEQVLGLPPDVARAVQPWVTVHSGLVGIDPATAPLALLAALEKGSPSSEAVLLARRGLEGRRGEMAVSPRMLTRSDQKAFTIRSTARTTAGAWFVREAVVELGVGRGRGFAIKRWRRGTRGVPAERQDPLPECLG
jgi:general secretion pathway protein K